MSDELNGCPWGRDHDLEVHGFFHEYYVFCSNCDIGGPIGETREAAITAWNRRASGWIMVGERLPAEGKKVLTVRPYGWQEICYLRNGIWYRAENGATIGTVDCMTAWQPLPEPPEPPS